MILNFFYEYFIAPLGVGYNPINSTAYAITLAIAILSIAKFLTVLKVKVDGKFMLFTTPFIVMGSTLRVLKDAGIFTSIFFVTPLIYFLVFGYTLTCLLISLPLKKRNERLFYLLFTTLGLIPATYFLSEIALNIIDPEIIVHIIIYASISSVIAFPAVIAINRFFGLQSVTLSFGTLVAHFLDASSTHIGVTNHGYFEQHFLVEFLAAIFNTTLVFFL